MFTQIKHKSHKILRTSAAVLLLTVSGAQAYPEAAAYLGAGITGTVVGGITYSCLDNFKLPLALLAGGATGYGAYAFLIQFTPSGRYKRACDKVAWVKRFEFARKTYTDPKTIIDTVNRLYRTRSWPLIAAFDDLVECTQKLHDAWDLAQAACEEEFVYEQKAQQLKEKISVYLNNIDPVLAAIKNCPDYSKQLEQAREEQRRQQELAIAKQMADAQTSSAGAQWHNASANHKIANAQAANARRW
jgi:hypothetical protein